MSGRGASTVPVVLLAGLALVMFAAAQSLKVRNGVFFGVDDAVFIVAVVLAMLAVGTLLVSRQPSNLVGWIVLLVGVAWAGNDLATEYARHAYAVAPGALPGATVALWFATWLWIVGLVALPSFGLLVFPDGRLPSRRWRPVLWCATGGLVATLLAQWVVAWGTGPRQYHYEFAPHAANPLHLSWLEPVRFALAVAGGLCLTIGVLGGIAAAVTRFRRARGTEREQIRWVVVGVLSALALYAFGTVSLFAYETVTGATLAYRLEGIFVGVVLVSFPTTIAVAVLRYRLYDIDRFVSRAVSYAAVTLVLGAIYVAGVVGAGAIVRGATGGAGGDLVVAGSTLLVAAAFRPVRSRIQTLVDLRFNRARYDARLAAEWFAHRTRDEVDLSALERDLRVVVADTLQPTGVSIWTKDRIQGRG